MSRFPFIMKKVNNTLQIHLLVHIYQEISQTLQIILYHETHVVKQYSFMIKESIIYSVL